VLSQSPYSQRRRPIRSHLLPARRGLLSPSRFWTGSGAKIAASLPEALRRTRTDARSFFLLPLVVREHPLGLFYTDRAVPDGGAVKAEELALFRALKGQALLALRIGNG